MMLMLLGFVLGFLVALVISAEANRRQEIVRKRRAQQMRSGRQVRK
jgi:hypothetical protein